MKEFMFMAIGGGSAPKSQPSKEAMAEAGKAMAAWMGKLMENGQLVNAGAPLGSGGTRIQKDGVVTDLSAIELKEIVAGYMIIKAEDMEAATQIALESPMVRFFQTTLDIREIMPAPKFN